MEGFPAEKEKARTGTSTYRAGFFGFAPLGSCPEICVVRWKSRRRMSYPWGEGERKENFHSLKVSCCFSFSSHPLDALKKSFLISNPYPDRSHREAAIMVDPLPAHGSIITSPGSVKSAMSR